MLLEIKVFGLHYLCGVRVTQVRDEASANETQFGFRYDTLEGHFEVGSEWFTLTKKHDSGEILVSHFGILAPGRVSKLVEPHGL